MKYEKEKLMDDEKEILKKVFGVLEWDSLEGFNLISASRGSYMMSGSYDEGVEDDQIPPILPYEERELRIVITELQLWGYELNQTVFDLKNGEILEYYRRHVDIPREFGEMRCEARYGNREGMTYELTPALATKILADAVADLAKVKDLDLPVRGAMERINRNSAFRGRGED